MQCLTRCTGEFDLKNINFDADTTIANFNWIDAFGAATNRFNFNYNRFIWYRAISTMVIFASFVQSIKEDAVADCIQYWPIYLTRWTLCLALSYSATGLYITYNLQNYPDKYSQTIIPKYVQAHWALQNPAFVTSFMVPIAFWPYCFTSENTGVSCYVNKEPNTLMVHGINSVLVISDIIISNQPFLLLHGIYPLGVGGLYLLWTYIHHILKIGDCKHPNQDYPIYEITDWNKGFNIYKGILVLLGMPIVNFLGWYLYYRKVSVKKEKVGPKEFLIDDFLVRNHISF